MKRIVLDLTTVALCVVRLVCVGFALYMPLDMVTSDGARVFNHQTAFDRLWGNDKKYAKEQQWLRAHAPQVVPWDDNGGTSRVHPDARIETEGFDPILNKGGQTFVHIAITQSPDLSDDKPTERQHACVVCYADLPISSSDLATFKHSFFPSNPACWIFMLVFAISSVMLRELASWRFKEPTAASPVTREA